MKNTICPKCGNETQELYDGRCKDCFFENFKLAELPLVLHAKICATCGARFNKNKWANTGSIEDIVFNTIEDALFIHDRAEDIEIYFEPRQLSPHMYRVKVEINASVMGMPLHQKLKTEVRITREACDACSRISGGYFEAIIQIRATNRQPSPEEIQKCMRITNEVLERMHKKGDRFAFISNSAEDKDGLDIYVGSTNASRHICKEIESYLGGSFSESPTLFGRKEGKDVYRNTFSMRLPEFSAGDIIELRDRVIEVRKFGKNVTGTDLLNGSRFLAPPDEVKGATLIAKRSTAANAVLVAIENNELMVLDPDTFETVTIKKPVLLSAKAGDEIAVVKTSHGLIALPEEVSRKNNL
ncbi:60S ribosomal export protein NMD3 [Methanolobus sp. ZRKC3]|uniref:60S ribosomal export protein NMD3 n=1 Tax=Methanolobus sp. ZRKC3 TaxID=3125786 RepID=UPI003246A39C